MDKQNFIQKFAEALDVEAEMLSMDTEFRLLDEWDSVAYLSIIAMLDEEYNIQIETATFKNLKTLSAVAEFIENNK
nr:acyl carrier protein [uncultured Prevotella sp.]